MKVSKTYKIDKEEALKIVSRYVSKKFGQKIIDTDFSDDIMSVTVEDEDLNKEEKITDDE